MKKVIVVNIMLFIVIFIVVTAYTDTLSTSKAIRITLIIEPEPVIEGFDETINTGAVDEKKKLEEPPNFIRKASKIRKDILFLKIVRIIRNIFQPK